MAQSTMTRRSTLLMMLVTLGICHGAHVPVSWAYELTTSQILASAQQNTHECRYRFEWAIIDQAAYASSGADKGQVQVEVESTLRWTLRAHAATLDDAALHRLIEQQPHEELEALAARASIGLQRLGAYIVDLEFLQ